MPDEWREMSREALAEAYSSATFAYELELARNRALDFQAMVQEFMQTMGQTVRTTPGLIDAKTAALRVRLIGEELQELRDAIAAGDLVEIADAINDLLYVTIGTGLAYGFDSVSIFNEIHRSNMSKVNPDGTVTKDQGGKVIKPPTYTPANVYALVKEQQGILIEGTCK